MVTTIEYSLLAGASYRDTRADVNRFPIPANWSFVSIVPQDNTTGFEASAYRNLLTNDIVISYAGTNPNDGILLPGPDNTANIGLTTGFGSVQLLQAAEYYLQVQAANPTTNITFTGHSLGGGLAALMGVFFDKRAVTFDQAPFANSAELNVLTPDVAANLKADLLARGYSEAQLSGLTDFLNLRAAVGGIPNASLIDSINVQGEFLSGVPWNLPDRIGIPVNIPNSASGVSGFDLHSQALLTAFVQSIQTATPQQALHNVTVELTDLMGMIFSRDLYLFDTDTGNPNFLERLVRHEVGVRDPITGATTTAADAMVTRFTSDLWKLAQEGGLTMTDNIPGGIFSSPPNNVSKTLIAFAMQKYYDETQLSAGYSMELFTPKPGGVHFDRADVAARLEDVKGYTLYFKDYLQSDAFTDTERDLIQSLLPTLRDWYVQAGTSGMTVTDAHNRGAFMLGGSGVDTLTGGTRADLLVGNADNDTLDGGAGADILIGGSGNDTYMVDNAGDQIIEGSNNGSDTVLSSVTFRFSTGDNLEHLTLTGTNNIRGVGNDLNNNITGNSGANRLEGKGGTDHLIGGLGNDILIGGTGDNDGLEGGAGFDTYYYLSATDGNDTILDSDGIGAVTFDAMLLTGGLRLATDPQNTWHSADGAITYVRQGANLLVNNTLTIDEFDFAAGEVGITLTTGPDTTRPVLPTIDFNNGQPSIVWEGDDSNNTPMFDAGANHTAYGRGGFDVISFIAYSEFYNHQVYGGLGNDEVDGGAGRDRLYGEGDQDVLRGWLGDDQLDGGDGVDQLQGGTGNDQLFGGAGNDLIIANNPFSPLQSGNDNDYADGGLGNDDIAGGQGNDVLLGGAGDDDISGEGVVVNGRLDRQTGHDYLDGGANNDGLTGGPGNDIVLGGTGDDLLNGDHFISLPENPIVIPEWDPLVDGEDYLEGGDGNDVLHGGGYDDILIGGQGNDRLWGDGFGYTSAPGDDWLDGSDDNDELYGGAGADTLLGGEGDDFLVGDFSDDPGDDDILDGGAGIDELQGSGGNDLLFGGTEADLLFGEAGDDVLDGGQGADELQGGDDNDVLVGGTEDDRLFGDAGTDTLDGGAGADFLVGDAGDDTLFGGEENDQLEGGVGADLLAGEAGNDLLIGGADVDVLLGGDGNDHLQGGAGDDELTGGAGADVLNGGAGADTYVFNLGDGVETIQDTAGEGNRVVFGAGIFADEISVGIGSLVVRVGFTSDAIHIQGFDPANPTVPVGIETFEFADGTTLTQADLVARGFDLVGTAGNDILNGGQTYRGIYGLDGNDFLTGGAIDNVLYGGIGHDILFGEGGIDQLFGGTGDDIVQAGDGNDVLSDEAGNDSLAGEAGDDVLVGGIGDDQLAGGAGNDTYQFNLGDGIDSISDSIDVAEPNRVVFGPGITSSSITLTTNSGQILVRPGSAFEGVTIGANGSDALGFHAVDRFEFADGSFVTYSELVARGFDINGTEFDDLLFGTNVVDRFRGGLGNDRMEGSEDNDSYFFNVGDGVDTIVDTVLPGAANDIVFGPGIVSSDLRFDLAPDQSDSDLSDLLIRIDLNGDAVQLDTFDRDNVSDLRSVETFHFADGSTLTYHQLLARGFDLAGTNGDDQINGTNIADRIVAGDGADVLRSGLGDDTLDGELGHDRLVGGQGNDTYVFGPGAGRDTILESQGNQDTIRMAPGVAPSDVVVTRNQHDLVLSLNGGADRLTVSLYFLSAPLQIERVQFADGTVWDQVFLSDLLQPTITGTGGSDSLTGSSGGDRLAGLAGDDQLAGVAGHDLLDGGTGADQLTGGSGDDTYLVDNAGDVVTEQADEGVDTIQSSVTRTIDANVERLTLIGSAAINGTGNTLDNVFTGNSAANVLSGGTGHDTYVVGEGDTVVELAGEGSDTVHSDMSYILGTNIENLSLIGSQIVNGVGNDLDNVLSGNGAPNVLRGGLGNDTYLVEVDDTVVELAGEGIDTIETTSSYHLETNLENLRLFDGGFAVGVNGIRLTGNDVNNVITGNRSANILDGGVGADVLIGGNGDDTYLVENIGDTVVEGLSAGVDTVQSLVNFTLGANVEVLDLSAGVAQSGTGNDLDNSLYGNAEANILDGGAGNDYLAGGSGQDTYLFERGSGKDIMQDSVFGEVNTILMAPDITPGDVVVTTGYPNSFFSLVIRIVSTGDEITIPDFFQSTAAQQSKAVQFADGTIWDGTALASLSAQYPRLLLFGDAFDNTLIGDVGDDEIGGNLGNDHLFGDAGNDLVQGGPGGDFLSGGLGNDRLYGESFFFNGIPLDANDTLLGDAGDDTLSGDYGNDVLDGGTGDDTLAGGDGNDQLNGGPGKDWLDGGSEGDVYVFGRGSGRDFAYGDGEDVIRLTSDVAPSDVTITRSGIVMVLRINGTQDEISAYLDPNDPTLRIGQVEFADGTVWTQATLFQKALAIVGTSGPDSLYATSLQETLSGGLSDDIYNRVSPQDTITEAPGEGMDTVVALNGVTLPANVENLTLYEDGTFVGGAERGIGNELNNIMIGNHADNVLDGGAGNDTLIGGFIDSEEGVAFGDGSDILIGGEGDDFLQTLGHSHDLILDEIPLSAFGEDLLIGGSGNDVYVVFHANESILERVSEGIDTVIAGEDYTLGSNLENLTLRGGSSGVGNELGNLLIGNSVDNVLAGEAGNDTLWGGNGLNPEDLSVTISGNDTLIGGTGDDTYLFKFGDGIDTVQDTSVQGEGNRIQFGVGIVQSDSTFTHDEVARTLTIHVGSSGTDQLVLTNFDPTGANGSLVVDTLAFADGSTSQLATLLGITGAITGTPGDDVLTGISGNDTIIGGSGNDTLIGGAGNDTYVFNSGDGIDTIVDTTIPGEGNTLEFGTGITVEDLSIGVGSLLIRIGTNGDALHLTNFDPVNVLGPRTIETFQFADGATLSYDQLIARGFDLTGTAGNDTLTGTNVVDRISGFAGDDTLQGGVGADTLVGGNGNDTYVVVDSGDMVTENVNEGIDLVRSSISYTLGANVENLMLIGGAASDGTGNNLDNVLTGNSAINILTGGAGNDTYLVTTGDVVTELTNEGTDTIQSSLTFRLAANVENLTLTGSSAINGTGNSLDNLLIGNSANNTLTGGAGHDTLDGGTGTDTMQGGAGNDTYLVGMGDSVSEGLNGGTDTIQSAVTWTLGSNVENLTLTGTANINGTGSSANNVLIGNSGNNTLDSGSGRDTVDGGEGNDSLLGGSGDDQLLGGLGDDTLSAGSGNDLLSGGDGLDTLDGGSGDDQLLGGAGNDTLAGGSGADQFTGGTDNDRMIGGSGNDRYNFSRGGGQDTIIDSDPFPGNQDRAVFGATINPLDLVISRQANDLRLAIHGSSDQIAVQNWYLSANNRIETIQAGNGQTLLSTQVDQLIQAMAGFTQQTGLAWDQAIDQQPAQVQSILAASWQ